MPVILREYQREAAGLAGDEVTREATAGCSIQQRYCAFQAYRGDPKAVIRDPSKNVSLPLPRVRTGRGARVAPPGKPRPMLFHAGQPREIVEEIDRIWVERSQSGQERRR